MKAALLIVLLPGLFMAGCGEDKDPNATIGGVKALLVENAGNPTWSPDGELIVFAAGGNLYSIDWQGGDPTQLTSMSGPEIDPDFLPIPGERKIVFINKPLDGDNGIYILDLAGGEPELIYSTSAAPQQSCFSSDGQWITFMTQTVDGIQRIAADGSGEPEVIGNEDVWEEVLFAQTSRSENTVLYIESRKQGSLQPHNLFRLSIDGGKPTALTSLDGSEYPNHFLKAIAESYDGNRLVFINTRGDGYWRHTVWIISAITPGADYTQITDIGDGGPGYPTWSPDNDHVAVDLNGDLYVIDLFE
jgi:Tol biopolymer transport system component